MTAAASMDFSFEEPSEDLAPMQVRNLTEALFDRTGLDFRDYAHSSLVRRIRRRMREEGADSIDELRRMVCDDERCMARLLDSLTLPVTSMFRDPLFFQSIRERVCPTLATYPYLRFWVAGCSSGQEVYSLAILLEEMGLDERSRIYATDLHPGLLEQAQGGVYPLAAMQEYTRNYLDAGGTRDFSEYYTTDSEFAVLKPRLRANVVFAPHNLVCDGSFNEFHLIFCRNVMIYFNERLQGRVHRLLHDSLCVLGFLGIGRSETIRFSGYEQSYQAISKSERIYRRVI